jgi:hypothetical protein
MQGMQQLPRAPVRLDKMPTFYPWDMRYGDLGSLATPTTHILYIPVRVLCVPGGKGL